MRNKIDYALIAAGNKAATVAEQMRQKMTERRGGFSTMIEVVGLILIVVLVVVLAYNKLTPVMKTAIDGTAAKITDLSTIANGTSVGTINP